MLIRCWVLLQLSLSQGTFHNMWTDLVKHLAKNLNTLIINIVQERFNARLNDTFLDLILYKQLNKKAHVSKKLKTLSVLYLSGVIDEKHLLVEIFLHLLLLQCNLHALSSALPLLFFLCLQFLELLLTLIEKQLLEIHLHIILVIVFAEQSDAQSNIQLQVGILGCSLHKYDFHELI